MKELEQALTAVENEIERLTKAAEVIRPLVQTPGTPKSDPRGVQTPGPKGKRAYAKRKGMPPLEVRKTAKGGGTVKTETPARAGTSAATDEAAPHTFAGAVKRVLRESKTPPTVAALYDAISTRWPDLAEDKDAGNVMANLEYAAGQGNCEKLGRGALATFRILKPEYFEETE